MQVIVTGASGFIGSKVVEKLIQQNFSVKCLLRQKSSLRKLQGMTYAKCYGDILDKVSLMQAFKDCETVIHLAGMSAWSEILGNTDLLEQVILRGTHNVLEAAKLAGVKRVVYVSSAAAVNASKTPIVFNEKTPYTLTNTNLRYSILKHLAESVALEYQSQHLDVVIVNPCEVYGPCDDKLVTAVTRN